MVKVGKDGKIPGFENDDMQRAKIQT